MSQKLETPLDRADEEVLDRRQSSDQPDGRDSESNHGERRKSVVDRRAGLERRRGPGKRRSESRRTAEEGELDAEQFAFVLAMDEYKRANKRPFPSWTEVLEVIKYLGYRKVAERGEHVDRPAESSDED